MSSRGKLNRVLAVVLVLWGGGMVVSGLVRGVPSGESAYGAGQLAAFGFGFLVLAVGLWTLFKRSGADPS